MVRKRKTKGRQLSVARPKGTPRILARRRNDPDGEPDPYTYCAHWRAAEVFSHLDHSPLTGEVEVPVAILTQARQSWPRRWGMIGTYELRLDNDADDLATYHDWKHREKLARWARLHQLRRDASREDRRA